MLEPQSWLPQARELALGERRVVEHDCGSGRKLIIEHKADGFSAWCHRCSDKGWHPHPTPSLAERIARLRAVEAAEAAVEADIRPPKPAEFDPQKWPLEPRVWLYKAGYTNDTIRSVLGAYWCERIGRVVLPVIKDGKCVYWQARGFDPDRPKYLNPPVDKPVATYGERGPLVLTEDILSGGRVGEVARARAILGTSLPDKGLATLATEPVGQVCIWLDGDAAGRKGRASLRAQLILMGVRVHIIRTVLDPKYYTKSEIEEFIASALK